VSVGLAVGLALATMSPVQARDTRQQTSANQAVASTIAVADLPPEAQRTERLIRAGGPFRHAKDGSVFGNRERLLPTRPRGFYREYTVRTPGSRDRGARRIVCGGAAASHPETCYYTDDHYASFRRIVQ
jgi:ribonuclease T1